MKLCGHRNKQSRGERSKVEWVGQEMLGTRGGVGSPYQYKQPR